MADKIISMDGVYRQKHYPKGFLAAAAKAERGGGIVAFVFGTILTLLGLGLLGLIIALASGSSMVEIVIVAGLGLFFLLTGIFLLRFGIRSIRRGENGVLQKLIKGSGYSESEVRDFANQAMENGSMQITFGSSGIKGLLTRDYFFLQNVMKMEDIESVYAVSLSSTVNVNGKMKAIWDTYIAVIAKHQIKAVIQAKEDTVKKVQELLLQKNPGIDTADGRIIPQKEYYEIEKQLRK